MPELPEVETTRRGIEPHLLGRRITALQVRQPRLRWPVDTEVTQLVGETIAAVRRRGKYLLLDTRPGTTLVHLGMSGSLRLVAPDTPLRTHDHVEWRLDSGMALRLHDPRRFGAVLWGGEYPEQHWLLAGLGPEPLSDDFDAGYLYSRARGRRLAVKNLLMDSRIVVGVGNIYASESLFMAGIDPRRAAGRIARRRYAGLVTAVKAVLQKSIEAGGTTLRDFVGADGAPGYFRQTLQVYEREGLPCRQCAGPVRREIIGQRSSYYCPVCQR